MRAGIVDDAASAGSATTHGGQAGKGSTGHGGAGAGGSQSTGGGGSGPHLPLVLVADAPLPGSANRFDYQDIDAARGHLIMAHMNDASRAGGRGRA